MNKAIRDPSIDALRGIAIFFMIISHALFFVAGPLHNESPGVYLSELINFGNKIAYPTFLFCFGYGLYYAILCQPRSAAVLRKTGRKLCLLLGAYLTLGLFSLHLFRSYVTLNEVLNFFCFMRLAPFTEFIPPFISFMALALLLRALSGQQELLSDRIVRILFWATWITSGFAAELSSHMGAAAPWLREGLAPYLIGVKGVPSFPLISYLPVLMLGLWQAKMAKSQHPHLETFLLKCALACAVSVLSLRYSFNLLNGLLSLDSINYSNRWPPTTLFLVESLTLTLTALVILKSQAFPSILKRILALIGRHSLGLLWFHLFVLFGSRQFKLPLMKGLPSFIFIAAIFGSYAVLIKLGSLLFRQRQAKHVLR